MSPSQKRIVFVGAGAVGGYVGASLASKGHDVTLIDPWAEHVDAIRREGMRLSGSEGDRRIGVHALHVAEIGQLAARPADIAFICTKLYDTVWAAQLIRPHLAPDGVVVTMQNSLVEETVAQVIGGDRTLGAIASMIAVEAVAPGHIVRTQMPGGSTYTTFRIGERSGIATPRASAIARLLSDVDSARVTTNLSGERWSKLVANCMTSGLCGVLGVSLNDMIGWAPSRRVQIRLGAEAIRVGEALGYAMEPIRGVPAQQWIAAAGADVQALQAVEAKMVAFNARRTGEGWSGTAQDLAKGRRTEVDWMNGYVAAKGAEVGVPAPTHAAVAELVRRMERREIAPSRIHVEAL